MNGWIRGEKPSQAGNAFRGFGWQGQQVGGDAVVEVGAGGVDGAAVEGLEGSVLELAVDGLGFIELPGLELADVMCVERFKHSLVAGPAAMLRSVGVVGVEQQAER